jgi:hypothetical protein
MRRSKTLAFLVAASVLVPLPALAWGSAGHRIINGAAMRALPASVPAFLRTAAAHDEIALLGPEADRLRDAGDPADADDDEAHFLDLSDDGSVDGVPLLALPASREAYDSALRAKGSDQYRIGFLPYAIADGYEHLVKDFVYWRVDAAGERFAAPADRAFFTADRSLRETLILRDIGYWGHFVADGSQPLHVTVHYNGWESAKGDTYPNPRGYSDSHTIHARFESALVDTVANEELVLRRIPAAAAPAADPILAQVGGYLAQTARGVETVYQLEARHAIDDPTPESTAFVLDRLAAGAAEMRDLIVDAWDASGHARLGYRYPVPVADFERGAAIPTRAAVGEGGE